MIALTIYGKEYKVPSDIREISIDQYINCFESGTDLHEVEFLSSLGNIPIKEVERLKKKDIQFFVYQVAEFIKESKDKIDADAVCPPQLTIDSQDYIVPKDLGTLSSGQWYSATKIMKDYEGEMGKFMKRLCAIYCLKKGEEFHDASVDLDQRIKMMGEVKFIEAFKIHCFFLQSGSGYLQDFQRHFQGETATTENKNLPE